MYASDYNYTYIKMIHKNIINVKTGDIYIKVIHKKVLYNKICKINNTI